MLQLPVDVKLGHVDKLVKAQILVGAVPLPGGPVAGMDGNALIAGCIFQQRHQGSLCVVHILLIGFAPRGKERRGVPGQEFILAVAGVAAIHRRISGAPHHIPRLLQGVKEGQIIRFQGNASFPHGSHVREGFIHHCDDGGKLLRIAHRFRFFHLGSLFRNFFHLSVGIALRFVHHQKLDVGKKARGDACDFRAGLLVPRPHGNAHAGHHVHGEQHDEQSAGHPQGNTPLRQAEGLSGLFPGRQFDAQRHSQQKGHGNQRHQGGGLVFIPSGNRQRRAKPLDVPRKNGLAPELYHKIIGNAEYQENQPAHQGGHPDPAGKGIHQGKHHEIAQVICQARPE